MGETAPVIIEGGGGGASSAVDPKAAGMIIISLTIVIILVMWWLYNKGKTTNAPSFVPLPLDSTGQPGSAAQQIPGAPIGTTQSQNSITSMAQGIHADLPQYTAWYSEIIPFSTTSSIWTTIAGANLSDTDAVNLWDTYNALFQGVTGKTLITDLQQGAASTFADEGLKETGAGLASRLQQLTGQTNQAA